MTRFTWQSVAMASIATFRSSTPRSVTNHLKASIKCFIKIARFELSETSSSLRYLPTVRERAGRVKGAPAASVSERTLDAPQALPQNLEPERRTRAAVVTHP